MTFSSDKSAPASGDTKKVLRLYYDDSAVDGIEFSQDPTTGAITVAPLGSGDNLDIVFGGKGTGAPKVGAEVVENQGNKGQVDGYASLDSGGLVPSAELGSGTPDGTTFLRGDQTWATPAGGSLSDGDKGDITVSSSGATWTIDAGVVSYAKMQDVSATDKVLGRSSSGAGDVEEIACTAAGRALLDDADASAQRTTLGLGTMATLAATARPMVVAMWARGDSTLTLTNMPSAEALVPSAGVGRMIAKVDLAGFTQVCLRGQRDGGTAATGCKLRLKYHTSYTTTVGTFSTIGTSEVQVTVDATGYFDSGWVDLVSGAKADGVFIAMTQLDGDGASDPTFGNIYASFR